MYAKMPKFVGQFPGCQCPRTPALLAAEVNTHQESKYIWLYNFLKKINWMKGLRITFTRSAVLSETAAFV